MNLRGWDAKGAMVGDWRRKEGREEIAKASARYLSHLPAKPEVAHVAPAPSSHLLLPASILLHR